MSQQRARVDVRLLVVLDGDLAIHEHVAISGSGGGDAVFVAGQVVSEGRELVVELLEVVDDDVRGCALAQDAAVLEAGAEGGQGAEPPVRVLERAEGGGRERTREMYSVA